MPLDHRSPLEREQDEAYRRSNRINGLEKRIYELSVAIASAKRNVEQPFEEIMHEIVNGTLAGPDGEQLRAMEAELSKLEDDLDKQRLYARLDNISLSIASRTNHRPSVSTASKSDDRELLRDTASL